MTGWRIGYGVMPQELVEPISRLVTNSVSCTASFTQVAAVEALEGPQDEAYRIVEEFRKRRDVIVDGLNSIPGITCAMPKGAFYTFPNVSGTGKTSREFADGLLEEAGVACLSGESFGAFGSGYVRFSFANSTENIERALERMDRYVAGLG
jgi:aspartate/methionine/tyrosine aminotransferase